MKKIIYFYFLFFVIIVNAQNFDTYFEDKTLRLDYIFAGNNKQQYAFLDELIAYNKWNGRKVNLDKLLLQGNGQIRVKDLKSNQIIYQQSYSTLFHEWLTLDEAKSENKSFENTFLVPFPKSEILVEVITFDGNRNEVVLLSHQVNPNDILIKKLPQTPELKTQVLHKAKIENPIRVAIVAEGFTEAEMPLFLTKANDVVSELFKHKAFKDNENAFNIIAVETISEESGVSNPHVNVWKNSILQSNFGTFYSERYLTTSRIKNLHNQLAGTDYEHIIILANTDIYGGGGIFNAYTLTTSNHKKFAPVVVHEFGHSFAGLADEYFYESDVFENTGTSKIEPWEQNITSLASFDLKWKDMLQKQTPIPTETKDLKKYRIGVFEGLKGNGLYIPSHDCRMKTNEATDFCPVCSRAINQLIEFYTKQQ
ncbi:M64 family metallopeptidase [Flavobacterium sp. I3-2]|uniref:M64 family metallopeptidase n=1 Tax=Flavobacterium sp. I3-2 TaxID=2748319 RepID=UPI0015ABF029|nr:M64 family metallopeptidase [Flavobacterium sp. I3-2]